MKNKFKTFLILSLILIGLSGCVKFNSTMDIKKDKSMDYSIIYAMNTSLMDNQEIFSEEDKKELETKGFKVEDYDDNKYTGVKLKYNVKNIDDISTEEETEFSLSKIADENTKLENIFKVKKGLLKNTYTANFKFDQSDSGLSDANFNMDDNDDGLTDMSSTATSSDTFKSEIENIYNQAQSKYINDSKSNSKDIIYCNEKACSIPNKINLNITKNYIIKFSKEGYVTYICIWDESYIYEKNGNNINVTDIISEDIKVNSNIKATKYSASTAEKKEVPFTFTPSYQTLDVVQEEDNNFEDSMVDAMMGSMDLKYIVNLPYKAISSNATEKTNDEKTLTWDLTTLKENDNIKYEFYIYNTSNIYLIVGGIVMIIIVIVVLLILKSKKSKKEQPTNDENNVTNDTNIAQTTLNEQNISNEINNVIEEKINSSQQQNIQVNTPVVNEITAPIVEENPVTMETPVVQTPQLETIEIPKTTNVPTQEMSQPIIEEQKAEQVVNLAQEPNTITPIETPVVQTPQLETIEIPKTTNEPTQEVSQPIIEEQKAEQVVNLAQEPNTISPIETPVETVVEPQIVTQNETQNINQ